MQFKNRIYQNLTKSTQKASSTMKVDTIVKTKDNEKISVLTSPPMKNNLKAIKNKLRIMEVPVNYRKRIGVSKISGTIKGTLLAGYKILSTIFKYSFS